MILNLVLGSIFFSGEPVTVDGVQYESVLAAIEAHPMDPGLLIPPLLGGAALYLFLAMALNRTVFSVSNGSLTITRGPLPWRKSRQLFPIGSLTQLYVEQYSSHSRNGKRVLAYRLKAYQLNGPPITLDSAMTNSNDARILEQWLEARLGIRDQWVPEELQPPVP